MKESQHQSNIIKGWESDGGHVVNGNYTKAGEADLQGGYPVNKVLLQLCVEVKTAVDYTRVMTALKEVNGRYEIVNIKALKKHEPLQVVKINLVREKGGLALFAYNIDQVREYVKQNTKGA